MDVPLAQRAVSALGLVVMVVLAWLMSSNRRRVPWRVIGWGVALQLVFGVIVLKTQLGMWCFEVLNRAFVRLLGFTEDGTRFLFGNYLDREFTLALNVLPTIVFFSSLMTVLYHLGVMQRVVGAMARVMQRTMGLSGSESLSAAANIFVGQTEAPLVVRPFVARMTTSELMAVMVGGFATVAGGVMAAYVGLLEAHFPGIAGHLIAASVMSAPAALVIAKVMQPEEGTPETMGTLDAAIERPDVNVLDAAARGARDGLGLAFNVAAMLLAFLALVAMVNFLFALPALYHDEALWAEALRALDAMGATPPEGCAAPDRAGELADCLSRALAAQPSLALSGEVWQPWTLERILSLAFWPLAFLMGVAPGDCGFVAQLLGEKMILNEFVAYLHLSQQLGGAQPLGERSTVIATYALCGFANFGSIAIQIGGIGGIAPERRGDLAQLGMRAMLGGTLAAFMTACVAGMLV